MFESIKSKLAAAKDRAVEASARSFLNRQVERFGTLTRLEVDSRQKQMSLEVLLKGEANPIQVEIEAYQVTRSGEDTFLTIQRARASREWADAMLQEFVVGKPQKVPDALRLAL